MIKVECPSCAAPYDLDERRLPASGLKMRCPKCGASFKVHPDGRVDGAPAPDVADLPAPKAPSNPFDEVDLPAPKGLEPPSADGGADLPAPKSPIAPPPPLAPPPVAVPKPEADLPAPVGAIAPPPDLAPPPPPPRPKAPIAPPPPIDLPARKDAAPTPPTTPDLPARKKTPLAPPPNLDLDLPARKADGRKKAPLAPPPNLDLDLPARRAPLAPPVDVGARPSADLPAPKSRGGAPPALDELDLPRPRGAGEAGQDLPTRKGGGGDLPVRKGSDDFAGGEVDLPAPRTDLGERRAATLPDADLLAPKDPGLDLPRPSGDLGDLDLPTPAAGLGDLDLPVPTAGTIDLPTPAQDAVLPTADGPEDLLADLPMPSGGAELPQVARPRGAPSLPGLGEEADFDLPDAPDEASLDLGLDDDLSLPEPKRRAPTETTEDGREGAGSARFGEIDLGGGGEEFGEVQDDFGADENEELDFSDLPEEALPSAGDGVVLDLPPDTAGAPAKPVAREGGEAKPAGSGKLRWALGAAALLALLIGGGYALKFTSLGAFGIYSLEGFLPASGDDAEVQGKIAEAERRAAADTYSGVRSGLRVLGEARAEASLNRLLMARSIVHEALYQVRFGPNARSEARESALLQKLAQRSNDAPGMSLALAASALRRGELRLAERQVQLALREDPRDPYGHLVAGELALAKEDANAATEAFAQAGRAGARAAWGTARAQLMAGEASLAAQAIEATLDESPGHAGARVASAAAARDAGRMERALRLAREAAGAAEVEGQGHIRASPTERARALTLVGEILMERGRRMAAGRAFEAAVDADPFAFRALLGLGNVLLIERRFTDALARFESAASAMAEAPPPREGEPPNAVRVGLGQVEALLDLEQVQRGSRMAADLAEVHPREPSVALWNGRALEALAKPEEAMAEYQRCVTLDAGGFDGYLAQAMLHFGNEDLEAAGTILAEARENVRMTARVHRQLGELELRRGNLGAAERELREAVRLDGNDPVARFALGQVRRRQGALDEAGALFDALAEADPSYPGLALERGRLFEAQGQAERAVQEYTRAAQQSPDDFDLLLRLGGAQLAAGNLEAAEETLRRVQEERPESAEAEYFMGRVAYARGENTTALTRLARAVSLDPRVGEYHLYLAKALLEKGEIGRSRAEVEQALELDDSLAEGYLLRGTIRLRLGRRTPAIDDFKRCLELRPGDGRAQVGMGEAYEELQDRERAIAAFQRAVELDGTQGEWWYRLGSVLLDAGRPGDAVTALAKATEIGDGVEAGDAPALPTWVFDAHRIRGDALRLAGRRADARGHYQRYLELAPDSALDREAVEARLERL